jgi:hypothetical protein
MNGYLSQLRKPGKRTDAPAKKGRPTLFTGGPKQTWIMAETGGLVMILGLFCYDLAVRNACFHR